MRLAVDDQNILHPQDRHQQHGRRGKQPQRLGQQRIAEHSGYGGGLPKQNARKNGRKKQKQPVQFAYDIPPLLRRHAGEVK